jgi:AraC-like DNA-binding protein
MKKIPIRHIKANSREPVLSGNFDIRDIRELMAGNDMVQELHRHDYFYLLALKKGKGHHAIDFTPYPVEDNAIFLMRPGQVHQLTLQTASTGYLLEFMSGFYQPHDNYSKQLLQRAAHTNFYQPGVAGSKKIFSILTTIFGEYTGKQEGYQQAIQSNLGLFFIELARLQGGRSQTGVSAYTQERLEDFAGLLETHIAQHKQVSFYADKLNLSPYQLNSITRNTLGKTSSALINEQIILQARRLLLATSGQVKEIAWQLGYEDDSYFIRFFRKHTGYTPDAFRQHFK